MILDLPLELIDIICGKIHVKILADILYKSRIIFTPFFHVNKKRLVKYWEKTQMDGIFHETRINNDIMNKISDILWADRLGH